VTRSDELGVSGEQGSVPRLERKSRPLGKERGTHLRGGQSERRRPSGSQGRDSVKWEEGDEYVFEFERGGKIRGGAIAVDGGVTYGTECGAQARGGVGGRAKGGLVSGVETRETWLVGGVGRVRL